MDTEKNSAAMQTTVIDGFDCVVIGGGHAGCEAALASARMGIKTLLVVMNLDSIAMMPCNPNIGGTSKGHLVRETDALGGEMGRNIDKSYIQTRMLNLGKGPAVHSLRAQADKARYHLEMKKVLENTDNLTLKQTEIVKLVVEDKKITGVVTNSNITYTAKAVVLCMGTYLKARCLYGETIVYSGPNGLKESTMLSQSMREWGIELLRFKTGTPARIDRRTINFDKMVEQAGDEHIVPFSFENTPEKIKRDQISCFLTYTNEQTHAIIRENIHRSPLYAGVIEGTGARYCPSIEDKIVRFADKDKHQIFIEPEGEDTNEMYIQGMSTSLPEDVQIKMYRSIAGLEQCEIMRNAYAIEYDCIDATQLKLSLEFKEIEGLFSAGQLNGSSGYEEAGAQGLVAGVNAALRIKNEPPLIIDRSEGYVGVLIDDLVTKGTKEPYRMMTSRAEYRLLLRQDNADLRLTEKGYHVGLISEERYAHFTRKKEMIEEETKRLESIVVTPGDAVGQFLVAHDTAPLTTGARLSELIKRPELTYDMLAPFDPERPPLPEEVCEQVNIQIKYEGYISRQLKQVEQFKKLESKLIPSDLCYAEISGLRIEARQKLDKIKPANIGHAARISGVSPADITALLLELHKR